MLSGAYSPPNSHVGYRLHGGCRYELSSSYHGAHCPPSVLYDANLVFRADPFRPDYRGKQPFPPGGDPLCRAFECASGTHNCTSPEVLEVRKTKRRTFNDEWVRSFEIERRLTGHSGCVNSIHLDHDGQWLLTGSDDLSVCIYDTVTWTRRQTYRTMHRGNIFAASFLPYNHAAILTCALDGQIMCMDSETGQHRCLCSQDAMCSSIATSRVWPQTAYVAYSHGFIARVDARCAVVDAPSLLSNPYETFVSSVNALAMHERYPYTIAAATDTPFVFLHDVRMGALRSYAAIGLQHMDGPKDLDGIGGLAFSQRGDFLALNYRGDDLFLVPWLDTVRNTASNGNPSGQDLFLKGVDGMPSIPLYQCPFQKRLMGRINEFTMFKEVAFIEDDTVVCTGGDDGLLYFWRTEDGALVHRTRGDDEVVNGVLAHPSLGRLITCGIDSTVKVLGPKLLPCSEEEYRGQEKTLRRAALRPAIQMNHSSGPIRDITGAFQEVLRLMDAHDNSSEETEGAAAESAGSDWTTVTPGRSSSTESEDAARPPRQDPSRGGREYGIASSLLSSLVSPFRRRLAEEMPIRYLHGDLRSRYVLALLTRRVNLQCDRVQQLRLSVSFEEIERVLDAVGQLEFVESESQLVPVNNYDDDDEEEEEEDSVAEHSEVDEEGSMSSSFHDTQQHATLQQEGSSGEPEESTIWDAVTLVNMNADDWMDLTTVINAGSEAPDPFFFSPTGIPSSSHKKPSGRLLEGVQHLKGLTRYLFQAWQAYDPVSGQPIRAQNPTWFQCVFRSSHGTCFGPPISTLSPANRATFSAPSPRDGATLVSREGLDAVLSRAATRFAELSHCIRQVLLLMGVLLWNKWCLFNEEGRRSYWKQLAWLQLHWIYYYMALGNWRSALVHCTYLDTWFEFADIVVFGSASSSYLAKIDAEGSTSPSNRNRINRQTWRVVPDLYGEDAIGRSRWLPKLLVPLALRTKILCLAHHDTLQDGNKRVLTSTMPTTGSEEELLENLTSVEATIVSQPDYELSELLGLSLEELRMRLFHHPNRKVAHQVERMLVGLGLK